MSDAAAPPPPDEEEDMHHNPFWRALDSLRQEGAFCDVTLDVCGEAFPAHRVVLAASSAYFRAMFRAGGLHESSDQRVSLHGLDPAAFRTLLAFMYTGRVTLEEDSAPAVLVAADMLGLQPVVDRCIAWCIAHLSTSNAVPLWQLADRHQFHTLFYAAQRFIHHRFQQLSHSLPLLNFNLLLALVSSEHLRIDGEAQVLRAIVDWVLHDKESRLDLLEPLFCQVRLPMINSTELSAEIQKLPDTELRERVAKLVSDNDPEKLLASATTDNGGQIEDEKQLCEVLRVDSWVVRQHVPRRNARKFVLVIGGFSSGAHSPGIGGGVPEQLFGLGPQGDDWMPALDCVEKYDTYGHDWEVIAQLNQPRSGHCAVRCRNLVYVMGGESESMISNSVEVYNPVEDTWRFLDVHLETPRTAFGAAVVDDTIYVLGGWIGSELGTTIECYDPRAAPAPRWHVIDHLPARKFSFGAVAHQGLIYVVGGIDEFSQELDTCEAYHPASRTWIHMPPMLHRRGQVAAVVCNGALYAIGGSNSTHGALSSVERLDFQTNVWTECAGMKVTRAAPAVAAWDGRVFVFCGKLVAAHSTSNITCDSAEVYDPASDSWAMLPRAPTSRGEAAAVLV